MQGRSRADGIQTVVALATSSFSESLIQRNPDGSLPRQTPELLSKMVPPMFAAVQRALAPLLAEQQGRLHEPAFVQVGVVWQGVEEEQEQELVVAVNPNPALPAELLQIDCPLLCFTSTCKHKTGAQVGQCAAGQAVWQPLSDG